MTSVEKRLEALRNYLKGLTADETTFLVEGGGEFRTKHDPFSYLWEILEFF